VKASGLTVAAVAAAVRDGLAAGYLRDPQITVEVVEFRSQSVFVMGEVRTPGKYVLSGSVTLLDALAQAGSITGAAGADVLILHPKQQMASAAMLPPSAKFGSLLGTERERSIDWVWTASGGISGSQRRDDCLVLIRLLFTT